MGDARPGTPELIIDLKFLCYVLCYAVAVSLDSMQLAARQL